MAAFLLLALLVVMFLISRATAGKPVSRRRADGGTQDLTFTGVNDAAAGSWSAGDSSAQAHTDCSSGDSGAGSDGGCSVDGGSSGH